MEKRKTRNYSLPARQVWIDAQLPPTLAAWLRMEHGVDAVHVEELGLHRARDPVIFSTAKVANRAVCGPDEGRRLPEAARSAWPTAESHLDAMREREESGAPPYRGDGVATNGGPSCGWRGSRRGPPTARWGQLTRDVGSWRRRRARLKQDLPRGQPRRCHGHRLLDRRKRLVPFVAARFARGHFLRPSQPMNPARRRVMPPS